MVSPVKPFTEFHPSFKPLTHTTPFTFTGYAFLEMYEELVQYLTHTLSVELNENLDLIYAQTQTAVNGLAADITTTKTQWEALFEQFMLDVIEELEGLNDQAVANLIANLQSEVRKALIESYSYGARVKDHATIQAAVARAKGVKQAVYLDGTKAVTGNIPGLWDVEFTGSGTITRGGYTFTPNPKATSTVLTNHLFINAQSGSDANDGLTPDVAIKSLSQLHKILRGVTAQQAAGAIWEVHFVGNFAGGWRMFNLPDFPHELRFLGEPRVGDKPATRITQDAAAVSPIGLWFEKCPSTIVVEDIWFDGFSTSTGYGVLGKGTGDLRVRRCRFSNCRYGYSAIKGMDYFFRDNVCEASVYTGSNAQYNSYGTWDNDTFLGTRGINVTRGTVCHIDYCNFTGNDRSVIVEMHSRANINQSHFKRNKVAVETQGAGEWINADSKFYVGTADANDVDFENSGTGMETRLYAMTAKNEFKVGDSWNASTSYQTPVSVSGEGNQLIYAGTALGKIPENFFTSPGKKIRVVVCGEAPVELSYAWTLSVYTIGSDGTSNVSLVSQTVPSGTRGAFRVEFEVYAVSANSQRYISTGVGNAAEKTNAAIGSKSVDFKPERLFRLYAQSTATGVQGIDIHRMETYLMG